MEDARSSLQNSWYLYWRYVGVSLRAQMQYRASFVMLALGNLLATGAEFLGIWALFARFGSLRGWSLPEVSLFYGMASLAFATSEAIGRGFDTFPALVKSGDFDRILLRPRSAAFQIGAQELQLMRVGRFIQGLAVLVWAMFTLHMAWTLPRLLLLAGTIGGGVCLFYGLLVLQATVAFWTVESLEVMNVVTYGGCEAAQYPLTIYRPAFQRFFTFVVPLACLNVIPARVLLARPDLQALFPVWISWLSPLVGVGFLLVAVQVWKIGVRHYTSTGS